MEIGAQIFTIRDFCKTPEDLAESLKKVADIGYKNIQISGTCQFDAEWLNKQLKANGLKCVITHTPIPRLLSETEKVAREHDIFGCDYVGLGGYTWDETQPFDEFFEKFIPAAEILKENGKYFMYHNHDFEFKKIDGKIILEHLMKVPADILGFTLDTYWVQAGGGDIGYWLERLSGRVPCIHLKDFGYGRRMEVIGEGNINFDRVFEKAQDAGTKYMLVEQDNCNGENPFDCLKRSYKYLKSRGF